MANNTEDVKQRLLEHMLKKYPDSKQYVSELNEEEHEMFDVFTEFVQQEANRQKAEMLDRLTNKAVEYYDWSKRLNAELERPQLAVPVEYIEAERKQLEKGVSGE